MPRPLAVELYWEQFLTLWINSQITRYKGIGRTSIFSRDNLSSFFRKPTYIVSLTRFSVIIGSFLKNGNWIGNVNDLFSKMKFWKTQNKRKTIVCQCFYLSIWSICTYFRVMSIKKYSISAIFFCKLFLKVKFVFVTKYAVFCY